MYVLRQGFLAYCTFLSNMCEYAVNIPLSGSGHKGGGRRQTSRLSLIPDTPAAYEACQKRITRASSQALRPIGNQ
jgi:hypothetical protein